MGLSLSPLPSHNKTDVTVHTSYESPEAAASAAATVHDKQNMGKLVRYYLRFDDGVVSTPVTACCGALCGPSRQAVGRQLMPAGQLRWVYPCVYCLLMCICRAVWEWA